MFLPAPEPQNRLRSTARYIISKEALEEDGHTLQAGFIHAAQGAGIPARRLPSPLDTDICCIVSSNFHFRGQIQFPSTERDGGPPLFWRFPPSRMNVGLTG